MFWVNPYITLQVEFERIQNIKVPFGIGHPHLHIKPSLYVCRGFQGSQIFKQNWIILICSRLTVIFLIWVSLALDCGAGEWGYMGWPTIVYMSSGMSRGKESWLVQDLLNFGVLGSLQLWGGNRWVGVSGGIWGHGLVSPHTCMHMYTCREIANGCPHGGIYVYHV